MELDHKKYPSLTYLVVTETTKLSIYSKLDEYLVFNLIVIIHNNHTQFFNCVYTFLPLNYVLFQWGSGEPMPGKIKKTV